MLRNSLYVIAFASLVAIIVLITAGIDTSNRPVWFAVLISIIMLSMILSKVLQNKASTAHIRCSVCNENMQHVQHNYPENPFTGLLSYIEVIHGADGRIYMQNGDSTPRWCQVVQELRICNKCKRYVILKKLKLIQVGTSRRDVEEREQLLQGTKQSAKKIYLKKR